MKKVDDCLIEIQTEELPPKALLVLSNALASELQNRLSKEHFTCEKIEVYSSPRRLALLIKNLSSKQPDQTIERKGPKVETAFDQAGNPTPACKGFAASLGVRVEDLIRITQKQGEWLGYHQLIQGKPIQALLPTILQQSLQALPIAKRMRWGTGDETFVRPVHHVILLYGDEIIEAEILGCKSGRTTVGHRFLSPQPIHVPRPADYVQLLEKGKVLVDFEKRRARITELSTTLLKKQNTQLQLLPNDELLDEVTGLVEWPHAILGKFEETFLSVPQEVLISAMQDHQRYFPVVDAQAKLAPYFVAISNIEGNSMQKVIHGNERVLRARLSDAQFFFKTDQHEKLADRIPMLKNSTYRAKLGSLYDKVKRLSNITAFLAQFSHTNAALAERAGLLSKADLVTQMVSEFPELQGTMGFHYACIDGEDQTVAVALRDQYLPRFSGDALPSSTLGQALAIADRLDLLVGSFGLNQIPTGEKDPYGLRRAAIGLLRIIIEKEWNIDLLALIQFAKNTYQFDLPNLTVEQQVLSFIKERLRTWYQEQHISPDVFASVAALEINNLLDMHARIIAVHEFKKNTQSEQLSIANKRVSNILSNYGEKIIDKAIKPELFADEVEGVLASAISEKSKLIQELNQAGNYQQSLMQLADLHVPLASFFDSVMVLTDDAPIRENRLLLLQKTRALFMQVADIALLQH